uniref:Uncharacterized protein n=1 Tax=Tanacetum cinerariifolium TaxID=118510 RepID=A0A699IYU0_TANCI|nr:hypothetical protein [Tanacetum cinerariifolium]
MYTRASTNSMHNEEKKRPAYLHTTTHHRTICSFRRHYHLLHEQLANIVGGHNDCKCYRLFFKPLSTCTELSTELLLAFAWWRQYELTVYCIESCFHYKWRLPQEFSILIHGSIHRHLTDLKRRTNCNVVITIYK